MANASTVDAVLVDPREKRVRLSVVLSGNYVQAVRGQNVGEVIDLTAVLNPSLFPGVFWGQRGPKRGYILNGPSGNPCQIIPGADGQHWLLKIFSAVDTELAPGAYSVPIKAEQDFLIEFSGNLQD